MSHNLTPDQRRISRDVRRQAYQQVPETCDTVRRALTVAADAIAAYYKLDPADLVALDVELGHAFCHIRDHATQPLRTAQMRALQAIHDEGRTMAGLYTEEKEQALRAAAEPLMRFLAEQHHPHVTAVVDSTSVRVDEALVFLTGDVDVPD